MSRNPSAAPAIDSAEEVVRFDDVSMRYGRGPDVLSDLTFSLAPGSFHFVTGPSGAKKELVTYIEREYPALAARIAAVQALDHPSDGELVKLARKFFVADDRMRSQLHS